MGIELASAYVVVRGDLLRFKQDVQSQSHSIESDVEDIAGRIHGLLATIGVGLGLGELISVAKESISAGAESIDVMYRLEAAHKAAAGAVGFTAKQLADEADEMMFRVNMTDESIKKSMATLMMFRNVTGEVFMEAIKSAEDLSAMGFGSVESSARMLGIVLESPLRGMDRLRRMGIILSQAQKDQIKSYAASGEILKAQTLILDIIKSKVGGVAEAMAKSPAGQLKHTQIVLEELREELGRKLLPTAILFAELQVSIHHRLSEVVIVVSDLIRSLAKLNEATGGWLGTAATWLLVIPLANEALITIGSTIKWLTIGIGTHLVGSVIKVVGAFKWLAAALSSIAILKSGGTLVKALLSGFWISELIAMFASLKAAIAGGMAGMITPVGMLATGIAALTVGLMAVGGAFAWSRIKGITFGEAVLDVVHKVTQLDNAFSKMQELTARELAFSNISSDLDNAFNTGRIESVNKAIESAEKLRAILESSLEPTRMPDRLSKEYKTMSMELTRVQNRIKEAKEQRDAFLSSGKLAGPPTPEADNNMKMETRAGFLDWGKKFQDMILRDAIGDKLDRIATIGSEQKNIQDSMLRTMQGKQVEGALR